jgi:hypothetical protein
MFNKIVINENQLKRLINQLTEQTEDEKLTLTQNNILGIINYNLEREQKESLLETKYPNPLSSLWLVFLFLLIFC